MCVEQKNSFLLYYSYNLLCFGTVCRIRYVLLRHSSGPKTADLGTVGDYSPDCTECFLPYTVENYGCYGLSYRYYSTMTAVFITVSTSELKL